MPYDFPKLSPAVSAPFSENAAKLAALFPSVVKDGKLDLDELRAQLGEFDEVGREKYGLTWAGKSDAQKKTGEALVGKTLKYIEADSKNPETTQNIYIEGDNLEALKLLQNAYRGKIKMIYIDPPYNTGNDFVYNDTFAETAVEAAVAEGDAAVVDGKIERYAVNTKTNGKYHANWLSMMYPRLQLARNLLSEDGVIFISIGEDELSNLKSLCDEIFGENNSLGIISRLMKTGGNKGRFFSPNIDYVLVFSKNIDSVGEFKVELDKEIIDKLYNKIETDGERRGQRYRPFGLYQSSLDERPNQRYYIQCPDGSFVIPPGKTFPKIIGDGEKVLPNKGDGCWRWSQERYFEEKNNNNLVFTKSKIGVLINPNGEKSEWNVYTKIWLDDRTKEGQTPTNFIDKFENRHSAKELNELGIEFDFAKPKGLIKYLFSLVDSTDNSICLDFFSGSGTTGQAIMEMNLESQSKRKFILIQLPENCSESGCNNLCELGRKRLQLAGDKIKAEHPFAEIDTGFKVFRVDDTNIKWIARELAGDLTFTTETTPKTEQKTLEDTFGEPQTSRQNKDTIDFMPQTNDIDIVYEILLHQYDIPLTVEIEKCEQIGNRTYSAASAIIICLEDNITPEIIEKIAALEPVPKKIFFRDSAFNDDISLKENAMLRLDALMQMHLTTDTKGMKGRLPYSVEFL